MSQAEIDAGTREGTPELLAAIANFTAKSHAMVAAIERFAARAEMSGIVCA